MAVNTLDDSAAAATRCYDELATVIERWLPVIPPGVDADALREAQQAFRKRAPRRLRLAPDS